MTRDAFAEWPRASGAMADKQYSFIMHARLPINDIFIIVQVICSDIVSFIKQSISKFGGFF